MKECTKCKIKKELIYFNNRKDSKDGLTSICKNCTNISNKKYRINNAELVKKYQKENRLKNKEYYIKYKKQYYIKNKEKLNKINKEYRIKNREKLNKIKLEKKKKNPLFKLRCNISNLILSSIKKRSYTKNSKTKEILGCTFEEFKLHLEKQFMTGMTWENQGQWHLDHIYPVSLAKDEEHLIKLNHYTNFQPLWAFDNLSKGNKLIEKQLILI